MESRLVKTTIEPETLGRGEPRRAPTGQRTSSYADARDRFSKVRAAFDRPEPKQAWFDLGQGEEMAADRVSIW